MLEHVPDFGGLGDVIEGKNTNGDLINDALLGREYTLPITDEIAAANNMDKRVVGRRVTVRILRNITGSALNAGEIVTLDFNGGFAGLGNADALSGAGDRECLVVDWTLGSTTVPDDDIFFGIVKGPGKVKQPATAAALVPGDVIKAGASGRLAEGALATDHGLIMGTCLETNNVNDALVAFEICPEWVG